MKEIHWTEFYREFYNYSEKTQKSRAEKLLDFGEDGEVMEVAEVFLETDEAFAAEFVKRAVEAGVRFCIDSIWELASFADEETVGHAALQTNDDFTREELEELCTSIDSDSHDELMERYGFDEDEEEAEEESEEKAEEEIFIDKPTAKIGFWTGLFSLFGGTRTGAHKGRCNGDCANCPPHYGYRYGRWYYGHNHIEGCEFGGNCGSGKND